MEFGLHESLPIYAGGLGILAGDHLKSASDTGVPLAGVSLLYRQGYFRQELGEGGEQRVVYPDADFDLLPMETVRDRRGREVRIRVELAGRTVALRLWKVCVGRVALYLLDADLRENPPRDRFLTHRLYVGDREARIAQEVIAGIGGVRALRAAGVDPGVWHLNEGHVAFLTLERLRELRSGGGRRGGKGLPLGAALEVVAADTVFTTHTPVPEGNEVFDLALASRYLRPHAEAAVISLEDYLALGLDRASDGKPVLSMTVLALRLSRFRNGVSALHGEVSRKMWSKLWPGFGPERAPITSVTNGVHTASWVAPELDLLYRQHLGENWASKLDDAAFWKRARRLPDGELWEAKRKLRDDLVHFVRARAAARLRRFGWSEAHARSAAGELLDPEALTIGFARRFALYKRAGLIFKDRRRAAALLGSRSRPVQLVYAGKPHPEDPQGKAIFEEIAALAREPRFRGKVVLLENYDIEVARRMVQGCDLWLNNPRRPLEASGTSGQKVPINCGLNLSVLDGWWCEGYSPDAGWAVGKPLEYGDPELQDREDHESLLGLLERQVVPLYYRRDKEGIPRAWLGKVKAALEKLVPRFSTHHMVREYASRLYRSAFEYGRLMRDNRSALARELAEWRAEVEARWPLVHLRRAAREKGAIVVEAFLGGMDPADLACAAEDGGLLQVLEVAETDSGAHRFRLASRSRPPQRYRLFPTHPELVHAQELGKSIAFLV
jgi:starch phosphorylase